MILSDDRAYMKHRAVSLRLPSFLFIISCFGLPVCAIKFCSVLFGVPVDW